MSDKFEGYVGRALEEMDAKFIKIENDLNIIRDRLNIFDRGMAAIKSEVDSYMKRSAFWYGLAGAAVVGIIISVVRELL